jgi:hypothetical protein
MKAHTNLWWKNGGKHIMEMTAMTQNEKTIRIKINRDLYDEFIEIVTQIEGYKKDRKKISLEKGIRLYINYCKPYKDKKLIEVARENDIEPAELGAMFIERYMCLYNELGLNIDYITNEDHFKLVKEHVKRHKKS